MQSLLDGAVFDGTEMLCVSEYFVQPPLLSCIPLLGSFPGLLRPGAGVRLSPLLTTLHGSRSLRLRLLSGEAEATGIGMGLSLGKDGLPRLLSGEATGVGSESPFLVEGDVGSSRSLDALHLRLGKELGVCVESDTFNLPLSLSSRALFRLSSRLVYPLNIIMRMWAGGA